MSQLPYSAAPHVVNMIRDNEIPGFHQPFRVAMGKPFKTFAEVLQYLLASPALPPDQQGELSDDKLAALAKEMITEDSLPAEFLSQSVVDTSLGGGDVFNPYPAYGEDDDIVHPLTSTDNSGNYSSDPNIAAYEEQLQGVGRVYSDTILKAQQVLWLQPGIPKFNNLLNFYKNSINSDLARIMHRGNTEGNSKIATIGHMFGSALQLAFELPWKPFVFLNDMTKFSMGEKGSTTSAYYDFENAMPLYLRLANAIIVHIAVNMGLYANQADGSINKNSLPQAIFETNLDLYNLLSKRFKRLIAKSGGKLPFTSLDDLIDNTINSAKRTGNVKEGVKTDILGAAFGGELFLGFRIEKTTDSSESLSNSSGASSIAGTLNSKAQEFNDSVFSTMAGQTGIGIIDDAISMVKGTFSWMAETAGMEGIAGFLTGSAMFSIPDVWKDSTFSRSYSVTIPLRSVNGDKESIFQNIMLPYGLLLALAIPRATGNNTYTSPFMVRGYCKGMFSFSMAMVESFSVTRGSSEHGWTFDPLPTSMDINISFKDMSPSMFLSLADGSEFLNAIFGNNTTFQEYLSTLSGLGLNERTQGVRIAKRRFAIACKLFSSTKLNPHWWAYTVGSSRIPRLLAAVSPYSSLINTR